MNGISTFVFTFFTLILSNKSITNTKIIKIQFHNLTLAHFIHIFAITPKKGFYHNKLYSINL